MHFRFKLKPFFSRPTSLTTEISLLYTFILGIILLVFAGVFYLILSRTLFTELDNELHLKASEINQNIKTYLEIKGMDENSIIAAVEKTITHEDKPLTRWWYIGFERRWSERVDVQNLSGDYINFISPEKQSLVRSANVNEDILKLFMQDTLVFKNGKNDGEKLRNINYQGKIIRVINSPFVFSQNKVYVIQVGIPQKPVVQLLRNWMISILLIIPVILLFTHFVGRLLASMILRPVGEITAAAQKISNENLGLRVDSRYEYREMNDLMEAFNAMIERLEQSFQHIQDFSAHAAHELKTPLTIIRGEAELALLGERQVEEYQRVLKVNLEEIERMLKIINDLLYLTKVSYSPDYFNLEPLELNEFLKEIYDQAKILASPKNIMVNFRKQESPLFISADRVHLRRLFFNLIDNALKFTPPAGRIDLTINKGDGNAVICVSDTGKGISEENLPKIFEHFFREDKEMGNGLGLSISQSIIKAHKGEIRVTSKLNAGTTFFVVLPLSS